MTEKDKANDEMTAPNRRRFLATLVATTAFASIALRARADDDIDFGNGSADEPAYETPAQPEPDAAPPDAPAAETPAETPAEEAPGEAPEAGAEPAAAPRTGTAARYAALKSYSDTGTVSIDYQWPDTPATHDTARFETAFRAPRNFFFRYEVDPPGEGDVFIIWCDGGDFQTWWKATGVHEVLDNGRGTLGFSNGALPTKEADTLIAPYLFPAAGMKGVVTTLLEIKEAGDEEIDGHLCRKVTAGGNETGRGQTMRPIAVWLDKESGLIRQVVVDAEDGSPTGLIDRLTFTLDPVANPELADDRFTFTPP